MSRILLLCLYRYGNLTAEADSVEITISCKLTVLEVNEKSADILYYRATDTKLKHERFIIVAAEGVHFAVFTLKTPTVMPNGYRTDNLNSSVTCNSCNIIVLRTPPIAFNRHCERLCAVIYEKVVDSYVAVGGIRLIEDLVALLHNTNLTSYDSHDLTRIVKVYRVVLESASGHLAGLEQSKLFFAYKRNEIVSRKIINL